jgi:hypothetical protein
MTTRNFRVNNGLSVGDITINASTNTITGISTSTPSADGDVVVKGYLDTRLSALSSTSITDGNTSVTVADNDDSTSAITFAVEGVTIATVVGDGITLAAGKELNGTATAAQYSDLAERCGRDHSSGGRSIRRSVWCCFWHPPSGVQNERCGWIRRDSPIHCDVWTSSSQSNRCGKQR